MIRSIFECEFLTDIVLNATAATEGNNSSLDYIPGAGFLGIAAAKANYDEFGIDAQTVFHSGKVRFGDGHIVNMGQRSIKVPASFFIGKGESLKQNQEIFIHHKISDSIKNELRISGTQIKQQRKEYFITDNKSYQVVDLSKNYAIKSAYDSNKRRAEDAKMFGYEWLSSGTKWQFSVDFDDDAKQLVSKVEQALIGDKRLGRSKTAQFGLVNITHIEDKEIVKTESIANNELVLYAESCLVFFNKYGLPTLTPNAVDFGLNGTIDWERSQILTRSYSPWNQKRFTREADRICIDKGSVIVIKTEQPIDTINIPTSVGYYRNEGLGQIIVNPEFLNADENGRFILVNMTNNAKISALEKTIENNNDDKKNGVVENYPIPAKLKDNPLLQYVLATAKKEKSDFNILSEVKRFTEKNKNTYKNIKASQWFGIRERASRATTHAELMKFLFGEISRYNVDPQVGYLTHGIAKTDWEKRNRLKELKEWIHGMEHNNSCSATIVLAAKMAKECNEKTK